VISTWRKKRTRGSYGHLNDYILFALLIPIAAFWAFTTLLILQGTGWFKWVGFDFGCFWSATQAFLNTGPASAYDMSIVHARGIELARISGYFAPDSFVTGVSPYPPVFFLLIAPFTQLSPVIDFLTWTLLNTGIAIWVIARLTIGTPLRRTQIALAALLTFPVMEGLVLGQPTGLMMLVMYKCWHSLVQKREFQSGLWAGVLLLKPQYALVIGLFMLLKRRWDFMRGFTLVGLVLAIGSTAILGVSGIEAYIHLLTGISSNSTSIPGIHPGDMLSINALVLNVFPGLTSSMSMLVTIALDLSCIAFLAWIWRGQWLDDPETLTYRLLATLVVTLLISNHNYVHGAVLLVIPCLAICRYRPWTFSMRAILASSLILPPILFLVAIASGWDWWIPVSQSVLVLMLAGVLVSYRQGRFFAQERGPIQAAKTLQGGYLAS